MPSSLASATPSREEILRWLGEYVSEFWGSKGFAVSGTQAHKVLRDKFGPLDYTQFGIERFKDFLEPGNNKFYRVLIEGTRHAIYPLNAEILVPASSGRSEYLKPEVWAAFTQSGPYYFDRSSGRFDAGNATDPTSHIAITSIADQTQKDWFLAFVGEHHPQDLQAARDAVATPNWKWTVLAPSSFLPPRLKGLWKRYRSRKISEVIGTWRSQHNVDVEIFSPVSFVPPYPPKRRHSILGVHLDPTSAAKPDDLRAALLQALCSMSTEELSRLPIPPCYVLPFLSRA